MATFGMVVVLLAGRVVEGVVAQAETKTGINVGTMIVCMCVDRKSANCRYQQRK
jgi:sugar (pentulose or hexulose) kinase